jgi:hypothetical protein
MLLIPIRIMIEREDHPRKSILKVTVWRGRTTTTTSMA